MNFACVLDCLKKTVGLAIGVGVAVGFITIIAVGIIAASGPAIPITAAVIIVIMTLIAGAFFLSWYALAAGCIVISCYEPVESTGTINAVVAFQLVIRLGVVGIYGAAMYRTFDMLKVFG